MEERVPGSRHRRRFNPSLWAAWALVAVMLAAGMAWLTGVLAPHPARYADYLNEGDQGTGILQGAVAVNLSIMGPLPLLIGLMGAFTLLTVQATIFRRAPR